MSDQVQVCCSCRFWYFKHGEMLCKRRSPTRDLMLRPCWPSTGPTDWCGEWEIEQRPEIDRRKSLLTVKKVESVEGIDIEL